MTKTSWQFISEARVPRLWLMLIVYSILPACGPSRTDLSVLTQHNNNARNGAYLYETQLTPSTVGSPESTFGLLYRLRVGDGISVSRDARIAAQPLFVKGVAIDGRPRDVLYVVTRQNRIYAFDVSEDQPQSDTRWAWKSFIELSSTDGSERLYAAPQLENTAPCDQLRGPVGIVSTPVIDPEANEMYVVFRTARKFAASAPEAEIEAHTHHFIAAIDIRTGQELRRHEIRAPGFSPAMQLNRAGLLLMDHHVYVAFGAAVCDSGGQPNVDAVAKGTPHGWVFAYRTSDLLPAGGGEPRPFNASPGTALAGIWQSGAGLAGDGRFIYALTGNLGQDLYKHADGTVHDNRGNVWKIANDSANQSEFGHSVMKLRRHGDGRIGPDHVNRSAQSPVNAFTAGNWWRLDMGLGHLGGDTDLGSGGPTVLDRGWIVGGGKQGRAYLLDPADMRQAKATFQFYHTWNAEISPCDYDGAQTLGPNIHGALVSWRPQGADYTFVYGMPEKEYLKAFRVYDSGTVPSRAALSTQDIGVRSPRGMPGGAISLSANRGRDAILWASVIDQTHNDGSNTPGRDDDLNATHPGRLLAFDALTLDLLWEAPEIGVPFAKFVPPTVAAGKVFRVAYDSEVLVYGFGAANPGPRAPSQTMQAIRPISALWRSDKHLELFMAGRLVAAHGAVQADVLSTNWEARCGGPIDADRGWRGWFPVTQTDGLPEPLKGPREPGQVYVPLCTREPGCVGKEVPDGLTVNAPKAPVVTALKGDPTHPQQVNVFVADADGRVMSNYWRAAAGWQTWFALSGKGFIAPGASIAATWDDPNALRRLDVFVVDASGRVMWRHFDTDRWVGDWVALSRRGFAPPLAPVSAVRRTPDHVDLFLTDAGGVVMSTYQERLGPWHDWFAIKPESGRAMPGQPVTAVVRDPQHLDLFITASDHSIKSIYWEPTPDEPDGWVRKSWFQIAPASGRASPGQRVTALYRNPRHLDLFIAADDRRVKSIVWEPTPNQPDGWVERQWFPIGAATQVEPGQLVTAIWNREADHLDLFITAQDGRPMSTFFDHDAWRTDGWFSLR